MKEQRIDIWIARDPYEDGGRNIICFNEPTVEFLSVGDPMNRGWTSQWNWREGIAVEFDTVINDDEHPSDIYDKLPFDQLKPGQKMRLQILVPADPVIESGPPCVPFDEYAASV